MPLIEFTRNLQRHVEAPPTHVEGATVREALEAVFAQAPRLRGYVLDEQGKVRQHMVMFIDGELVRDRDALSDAVQPNSVIDVIQALSGGRE